MNTILLEPSDVLFFRDGRPMSGSLAGHGAAWPLPNVTNAALHAALHRAGLAGESHTHRLARSRQVKSNDREQHGRKFGSLVTAGPFPVCINGSAHTWFFPHPADADDSEAVYFPLNDSPGYSSLPQPLKYPVANSREASKESPKNWWNAASWSCYLEGAAQDPITKNDCDFADIEHNYGIGIDPETGSVEEAKFYSAHSLRLKPGINLGVLAEGNDKGIGNEDIIHRLFDSDHHIIVGGQQRICSVSLNKSPQKLPLPMGRNSGFEKPDDKYLVKWVLLTPAIWPDIQWAKGINPHTGGWLPNWIAQSLVYFEGEDVAAGSVLLLDGPGKEKAKRKKLSSGKRIGAKLVAAIVGKSIPVTGYALANEADPERVTGGAKSTHLAVPAGAVYYFEADPDTQGGPGNAIALANALNWHGSSGGGKIMNRRSTLMGEKGFGLGVCGTWNFYNGNVPGHPA